MTYTSVSFRLYLKVLCIGHALRCAAYETTPKIALTDSDRQKAPVHGKDVLDLIENNFNVVPPVLRCSKVPIHRYSFSETPGCNISASKFASGYLGSIPHKTMRGSICCDHVVTGNGMSSLCLCQPHEHNDVSRYGTQIHDADLVSRVLEVDALFVLPPFLRHAPHWLEQLAQLCNALTLDVPGLGFEKHTDAIESIDERSLVGRWKEYRKFPAVLVELPLDNLGTILDGGYNGPARAARTLPSPIASHDSEVWADEICSVLTAALLQHTTHSIFHATPKKSSDYPQLAAYFNISSRDTTETRRKQIISGVVTQKQIHPHPSIRASSFLPFSGRHFFASRQACAIYRRAIQPLWDEDTDEKNRPFRVTIANRHSDMRTITNVDQMTVELKKMKIDGFTDIAIRHDLREDQTIAQTLKGFGDADVVIAAHGGVLAMLPAMRPGSLVIEVFADPELGGTCLSYFLGLGTQCGIAHRVYHGSGRHMHMLNNQGVKGCWLGNGRQPKKRGKGGSVNPKQIVEMILEWAYNSSGSIKDRTDNPGRLAALRSSTPCAGCRRPVWWESADGKRTEGSNGGNKAAHAEEDKIPH